MQPTAERMSYSMVRSRRRAPYDIADAASIIATPNPAAISDDDSRPSPQSRRQASPIQPAPMKKPRIDSTDRNENEASLSKSASRAKSLPPPSKSVKPRRSRNRSVPANAITP